MIYNLYILKLSSISVIIGKKRLVVLKINSMAKYLYSFQEVTYTHFLIPPQIHQCLDSFKLKENGRGEICMQDTCSCMKLEIKQQVRPYSAVFNTVSMSFIHVWCMVRCTHTMLPFRKWFLLCRQPTICRGTTLMKTFLKKMYTCSEQKHMLKKFLSYCRKL